MFVKKPMRSRTEKTQFAITKNVPPLKTHEYFSEKKMMFGSDDSCPFQNGPFVWGTKNSFIFGVRLHFISKTPGPSVA